ncbi:MAG: hypothetical protein AAF267_16245 [Deinococcota bacterium]
MFCQFSLFNIYKKVYFQALRLGMASLVLIASVGYAQSVWLESGLAYRENATGSYEPLFKVGLRGFFPLSEPLSLYGALAWRDGLVADAGVWYAFDPNLQDPFGFQTYGGAGLTFVSGNSAAGSEDSFGIALSVAASYAIDETFGVAITYTHRPLLLPELSQAFDISLGIILSLDTLLGGSDDGINLDSDDVQPLTAEPADGSTGVIDEVAGDDLADDDLADDDLADDDLAGDGLDEDASDIQEESPDEDPSNEDTPDDSDSTPDEEQP